MRVRGAGGVGPPAPGGRGVRGRSPGAKMRLNGCLCCKKQTRGITRGITRRAKAGPGALMGDERPGKDEAPGVRGQGPGGRAGVPSG